MLLKISPPPFASPSVIIFQLYPYLKMLFLATGSLLLHSNAA